MDIVGIFFIVIGVIVLIAREYSVEKRAESRKRNWRLPTPEELNEFRKKRHGEV